jgi:hypothetical protein
MTVLITLTVAGADSGPFNLFSNLDGYASAFATGISKSALLAGYSSSAVPDYTTTIRLVSVGNCNNYIDIILDAPTTTTTSSSSTSSTTTTSTTLACNGYILYAPGTSGEYRTADYIDCAGEPASITAFDYTNEYFCASSITGGTGAVSLVGPCSV